MTDLTPEQIEAVKAELENGGNADCQTARTMRQALTAIRQLQRGWMGIESMDTAPRDRTPILAKTATIEGRWGHLSNRWFVISYIDNISGWSLFPGMGWPDEWLQGWMPLPLPPAGDA